jgi:hypothetical protein
MVWICEKLELPKPDIEEPPAAEAIDEVSAMAYLCYLLPRLREPLKDIPLERFFDKAYPSKWKSEYCIDGMLEHILVHPQKHRFQLEELIELQKK